jgi:hypothetical protein
MTGPRIDPTRPHIMSGDEWEASQYAPASAVADPTKPTNGFGRILTGDEWEEAQRKTASQMQAWKLPALPTPTIARDVTKTPLDEKTQGKKIEGIAGVLTRQIVDPVLEHPFASAPALALGVPGAAAAAPVAAAIAGVGLAGAAVYHIAQYGWQKLAESQLDPETRKLAEADPERISGESAAVQAAMLGLGALIHVGSRATDFSSGMTEAGARGLRGIGGGQQFSPELIAGARSAEETSRFAAQLAAGAQEQPGEIRAPKGFEPTAANVRAGRVKPVEGLVVPESTTPGRVKAIETESSSAPLEERANIDEARRSYEAQRVAEDQSDIAAQRTADAERLLGLRDEEPSLAPRRRPGGAKQTPAPFFETPTGAETLGATAARHGLPEEANPYHPESPLAPVWEAGHQNATQSYPLFPEGFTMGGAESRIPPGFTAERPQGFEPTAPEGATPETAQLAAALKPSRFRGHATDELVKIARTARETIDRAQSVIDAEGGETGAVTTAEKAVTRANSTLAQVEREFALRGVTGDQLAQRIGGEEGASSLTPIEGTGPKRTRGLSAGIQEKAIANKLDVAFGDLPEYGPMSIADQAEKAAALLKDDPALALEIAKGNAQPPRGSGLHPESVLVAVENKAIADGDVATLRDLATGKLTGEGTAMGQRIRLLGERDTGSPVSAIQDVIKKRTGGAENAARATEAELTRVRGAIAGATIEKGQWAEFVNSLKC